MTGARAWLGNDGDVEVLEPLGHLAIFGQTRKAGKTTSLREIAVRAAREGVDVLVFRTGRAEIPFPGTPITPFFRERLDWRSVEAMLQTFLGERPKIYRPIVMKAVRGVQSLEDVHANIVREGKKSRNGWVVDRTFELDNYFQEILPWLRTHHLAMRIPAIAGFSMMDMEGWPLTVQQLVVAATLDVLMETGKRGHPLLVLLPEARDFIPSDRAAPSKLPADQFVRRGAKLNLFLWIDSQSLTGVDQQVLRNFALILQGVQTSDLEVRRICSALDGVKPVMVRRLRVGDFILHTADGARTVHVPLDVGNPAAVVVGKQEENVEEKERKAYEDRIEDLGRELAMLREQLRVATARGDSEHDRAEANAKAAAANAVQRIRAMATPDSVRDGLKAYGVELEPAEDISDAPRERIDLHVTRETPNLSVRVKEVHVDATGEDLTGQLGILISEGFFDKMQSSGPVVQEIRARGWGNRVSGSARVALLESLRKFCAWGFLRELNSMFQVVPEAKRRVRTLKEEVRA